MRTGPWRAQKWETKNRGGPASPPLSLKAFGQGRPVFRSPAAGCGLQASAGAVFRGYLAATVASGISMLTRDSAPARTATRLEAVRVLPSRTISAVRV